MWDDSKKVPNTHDNARECMCPECPVYNKCMKESDEHLFCSRGKTGCNFSKTGCYCPKCSIWLKYNLVSLFYCEKGTEH